MESDQLRFNAFLAYMRPVSALALSPVAVMTNSLSVIESRIAPVWGDKNH